MPRLTVVFGGSPKKKSQPVAAKRHMTERMIDNIVKAVDLCFDTAIVEKYCASIRCVGTVQRKTEDGETSWRLSGTLMAFRIPTSQAFTSSAHDYSC